MKIRLFNLLVAGVFITAGFAPALPDKPVCIKNDRYQLTVLNESKVVLEGAEIGRREFDLAFTVFFNLSNPELKLRPMDDGTRYNITTWKAAVAGVSAGLAGGNRRDAFAEGDGFDASILKGDKSGRTDDLFQAGSVLSVQAANCSVSGRTLRWAFDGNGRFTLSAELTLPEGNALPVLTYCFTPLRPGYYSIGYIGAPGCTIEEADEIWQPLIWQEKRFPQKSHLTLAFHCPVPSAFVTRGGVTVGVVADSKEFPFDPLPLVDNSRFGVAVRDAKGLARPMLFAPVLGGAGSEMKSGVPFVFSMRLFAGKGDTTDALEQTACGLFGFRDYRSNAPGSMNRTIDNMTDYGMSHWSLFDEENKGCNYSTDAPGAVKNVSSIDPLDLAIVMDSEELFKRRAYPYMEYMLSRGKFLFTTDESQKIQFPSYRLNGPTAPISELGALYSMFHGASPVFRTLAADEYGKKRVRNLDEQEDGKSWWTSLTMYRASGDGRYLEAAKKGADEYIKSRMDTPQTDFKDPQASGFFFWTGYAPRYIDLLMLYEATGEQRYLEAAHKGARRYAQYIWFAPAIPDEDITVNKDGKAPEYWYLKGKGHKPVFLPEETVPAWRLSEIGLTPESSGTSSGHRAIFMANHAPWMRKIGYLCNDFFLMDVARSAVIGRYSNFPGYHINTARTTAYEKENFPLIGHKDQSVTSFHYNHVFPMISMLLDYLVTDAHVRSGGAIDFSYNYSEGYAYLQNKAYGAMTGRFYGHHDALLWMPQRLLAVPDQINYIAARGTNSLYLALMNESAADVQAKVEFNEQLLPDVKNAVYTAELIINGKKSKSVVVANGKLTVPVPARGLSAVIITGLTVKPQFQNRIADLNQTAAWDCDLIGLGEVAGRAMILNLGSQTRTAYVFLEYSKQDFVKVEMVSNDGSGERRTEDRSFPWEFTVPVAADAQEFRFILNGHKPDGTVQLITPSAVLKRYATAEKKRKAFYPGVVWPDVQGERINAHGFSILYHGGRYYWYGAHKIEGLTESQSNEAGVRCYTSTDLLNWENAGMVLSKTTQGMSPEVAHAGILDRPKVIYIPATGRFVMYFKLYDPISPEGKLVTKVAYVGVATATQPTGPFEYHGKFLGGGSETGSGDFAIFQDSDGAAYHIAVRKPDSVRKDKPLVCGRLTADGLKPAGEYVVMNGVENATEAPALFRRDGKVYLLGSGSSGWAPNAARLFVADYLTGPYKSLGNPCRGVNPHNQLGPEKTFGGQSTFVYPVPGKKGAYIAMFDINQPEDPINAGYIWLPLKFTPGGPRIEWRDEWDLSVFNP
jgi:hypothetical protein